MCGSWKRAGGEQGEINKEDWFSNLPIFPIRLLKWGPLESPFWASPWRLLSSAMHFSKRSNSIRLWCTSPSPTLAWLWVLREAASLNFLYLLCILFPGHLHTGVCPCILDGEANAKSILWSAQGCRVWGLLNFCLLSWIFRKVKSFCSAPNWAFVNLLTSLANYYVIHLMNNNHLHSTWWRGRGMLWQRRAWRLRFLEMTSAQSLWHCSQFCCFSSPSTGWQKTELILWVSSTSFQTVSKLLTYS